MESNTLYILEVRYVDEKKIRKNIVLGFVIEPRFSSALSLLGQN
jgi:hypothetical protein